MPSRNRIRSGFLLPANIQVAQRAFDRLCAARGIAPSCDEAAELAATVIAFFQRGTTEEDDLVAEVSALHASGFIIAVA